MKPVPHGEPYAGKLHVRFDEGAGVPDNKGRSALLYTLNAPTHLAVNPLRFRPRHLVYYQPWRAYQKSRTPA